MKIILSLTLIVLSSNLFAQDSLKNKCKAIECVDSIVSLLPGYSHSYDTTQINLSALVYKNSNGDLIQFFYDNKIKPYQLKSIVANKDAIYTVYTQYFGRVIDKQKLQLSDRWRYKAGSMNISKYDGWEGYWLLRF